MSKQKPNFKCNQCECKFYVQEYIITSTGKVKDRSGVTMRCPSNPKCIKGFTFIAPKKGVPELLGASNGTFPSESELVTRKQDFAKLRSRHHFKNEVLPTHPDKHLKKHFEKKYKGTKMVDHEKMKL